LDAIIKWNEGLQFKGSGWSNHGVTIDTDPSHDGLGQGPSPVELLLMSVAGCTGMDVVSILNKMKVKYDRFEIGITGERAEEHPRLYHNMTLVYQIWGADIDEKKFNKAIDLSMNRYCTVSNTLKQGIDINYRYEVNPENEMEVES